MRTIVKIIFDGTDVPGGPMPLLRAAGCGSDVAEVEDVGKLQIPNTTVTLDTADERLSALIHLLFKFEVGWIEMRSDRFTDKELENARLILAWSTGHHEVFGGPRLGTQLDLKNACPKCTAGATQTSPLMIDAEDVPKLKGLRATGLMSGAMIVDEGLAEALEALGAKGLSFRDVYAKTRGGRQTKLPWKQLVAKRAMPRLSRHTTGVVREKPCTGCERSLYNPVSMIVPARLAYRVKDLRDIDDVMTTWEWFGHVDYDGDIHNAALPHPWLLMTPRVWRVFRDAGVETFDWLATRMVNRDD